MKSVYVVFVGIILYLGITWQIQRKRNRIAKIKKGTEIINLGSTYAYYDLDYSNLDIKAYNLANVPQYLDVDNILLKKCINKLKQEAKILIVLPNFVFAGNKTNMRKKVYYEALYPWEIKGYDIAFFLKLLWRAAIEPITHYYRKAEKKWDGHIASVEEKEAHLRKRIYDWENIIGIPSVRDGKVTEVLHENIVKNEKRLIAMIQICQKKNLKPLLVIPPVSGVMKKAISRECLQVYLYDPVEKVRRVTGVGVLNYQDEKEFESLELYLNSDCMNEKGRKIFTRRLLEDIRRIFGDTCSYYREK